MPGSCRRLVPGRTLFILIVLLLAAAIAPSRSYGQSIPEGPQTQIAAESKASPIPLTYDPAAAKKTAMTKRPNLGRAVVIAFGSLPFTAFYTDFVFDSVRFADNGFDLQYAPWPFKNSYSVAVGTSERFIRLGVSLGVSAVIGLIDLILSPGT
jgi:hypothetical protein